ncbi:MAG: DNA-protecting protein DprA [Anaerolineae bacterium]|nr:DNA-protecting protein DprA [Anaerolineae bacterium]MCA9907070.1 DNA-protecting protein DprA [Anaerolineae bacterium]
MVDPAWVALSLVERVGGKTMRALIAHFGSAQAVLAADSHELRRVPGIGAVLAASIRAVDLSTVEHDLPRWQAAGIRIILDNDPAYPPRLRALDDAPPTLFIRGDWSDSLRQAQTVAIVGTRSPSDIALDAARALAFDYAQKGYVIVSGLALGIDRAAHMGALGAAGHTLAVLGGGLLNIYPPANKKLADAICGQGALLSESHPTAESKPAYLVARNRIISGLCNMMIVVETNHDGGAMHAARWAREQQRPLYTLDIPASGNQQLIDQGATPLDPFNLQVPLDS